MVFTDVRSAISGVLSAASPLNVENWLIKLCEFDLLTAVEAVCLAGSDLFMGVSSEHGVVTASSSLACRPGLSGSVWRCCLI